MVTIEVKNQQKKLLLDPLQISLITKKILKALKVSSADLSIAIVTDRKIKSINSRYLQHHYATDVLAFDFMSRPAAHVRPRRIKAIEGEIVVSSITAYHNSKIFKTSPFEELVLYIIHGTLHLLGFDDHDPVKRQEMSSKEREIMGLVWPLYRQKG